jgi:hypothetical protein
VTQMMLEEPRIEPSALEATKVPTLILAGDHDLLRDEHTSKSTTSFRIASSAYFRTRHTSCRMTIRTYSI